MAKCFCGVDHAADGFKCVFCGKPASGHIGCANGDNVAVCIGCEKHATEPHPDDEKTP
jgi:hypothetical protein